MGLQIADRTIDRLCIIDDDESARNGYADYFLGSDIEPYAQGKIENIDQFFDEIVRQSDAVISDHNLRKKSYFPINGAEVVSKCFQRNIPSLLFTIYDNAQLSEIRKFRKNIPIIINPRHFDEETIFKGLELCINEFKGEIRTDRRLWKTLVRIDSMDDRHIYIIIPGWNTTEAVPVEFNELPPSILALIEPDKRMHVKANIGCESMMDLYFEDWEL